MRIDAPDRVIRPASGDSRCPGLALPWACPYGSGATASLVTSRIRPVVIGAFHAFPEGIAAPEQESRGVNDEEHDVHGIAFRVREAEEAEDGEIEGHSGDEREYQRVAVSPEIMRPPHPRGIERADEREPELDCGCPRSQRALHQR